MSDDKQVLFEHGTWQPHWQDSVDNALWLELLHPFTGVKNLYLSEEFARRIVPALKELVEGRMTEVLPTKGYYFLGGARAIENFPGGHREVRCHATGYHSPCSSFSLGQKLSVGRLGLGQKKGQGSMGSTVDKCSPPSAPLTSQKTLSTTLGIRALRFY